MIVRAADGAETGVIRRGDGADMRLPDGKERPSNTPAAIGWQQYRLSKIEEPFDRPAKGAKRRLKVGRRCFKRQAGGGTDRRFSVVGDHHDCSPAGGKRLQMVNVAAPIAVVQMWPVAK